MITIPLKRTDDSYDLAVILDEHNVGRIKEYDPAEVDTLKLCHPWNTMKLRTIVLMFSTEEEIKKVMSCKDHNDVIEVMKLLSRGFKYRPEAGDHDGPYENTKSPGN